MKNAFINNSRRYVKVRERSDRWTITAGAEKPGRFSAIFHDAHVHTRAYIKAYENRHNSLGNRRKVAALSRGSIRQKQT